MLQVDNIKLLSDFKKDAEVLSEAASQSNNSALRSSLAAYRKFLEQISADFKKHFLLAAAILLSVFTRLASAEARQTAGMANELLSGKIFDIKFTGTGISGTRAADELFRISFKEDKIYFSQLSKEYYHFFKFPPSFFYAMVDSTQGGMILFSSQSKNKKGETLLWLGSVSEDKISGTMVLMDNEKCKLFHFSGTLKYMSTSEGKI